MTDAKFYSTAPVLASLDMDETEKFYTEKLGFTTNARYPDYLIMVRDDVCIHFNPCDDRKIAENTSCYVYVKGAKEIYEEFEKHEVIHPNGKLHDTDYGIREFAILDCHGNCLRIGENL